MVDAFHNVTSLTYGLEIRGNDNLQVFNGLRQLVATGSDIYFEVSNSLGIVY